MKRISGEKQNRNLFLVNNRPDVFTMEGPGDIALLQPVDDLNLMNDLTALKGLNISQKWL